MNSLVKILFDEDGEKNEDPEWCLVDPASAQGAASLCTSEFFGEGESTVVYEYKQVARGGITCAKCIEVIKTYKAVRL